MKMIQIDKNLTRQIIASAYGLSNDGVINPSLCIAFGKCVYMFRDAIERGIDQGMHLLYVRNFKKEPSGWVYNLNNSVILFIDKAFFANIDMSGNDKNVKVDISSLLDDPSNFFGVEDDDGTLVYKTKGIDIDLTNNDISISSSDTNISLDPSFNFENSHYDPDQERDHAKLTRLEYACILLKVPNTGKDWLDNLILQSRKLDKS